MEIRKDGKEMIRITDYDSPIGKLILGEREGALAGLWIEGQTYFPDFEKEEAEESPDSPVFHETKQWLERYFAGKKPRIDELKLAAAGSKFRRDVWNILCQIPYGQVMTYGEISRKIAAMRGLTSMSAQAVGGAVGHNPISVVIPCHRVVGGDGSMTGYAGGIQRKIWLLKHEGVDVERLQIGVSAKKRKSLCQQTGTHLL